MAMISVLYVDDDTSLLEIGKFLLEKDGSVEVDTCTSVNAALEKISGKRYDVIISDYAMPGTNGIKFFKSLRSAGDTTPFFFFAGKGRKSVIIDALNLGADFYLEKAGNAKVQFEELLHEVLRVAADQSMGTHPDQTRVISKPVLESLAGGVLIVDPSGTITAFNQNFLSIFQMPEDLAGPGTGSQVLLKYIQDQLEDPGEFSRTLETVAGDPGITCHGTLHGKEGQVFTWSSQAWKTGDTISGRTWTFSDISDQIRTGHELARVNDQLTAAEEELARSRTEREENEAVMQKNKEILDIILRTTSDGILTTINDTIVEANDQFAAILGYTAPELAGRSLLDLVSPDSSADVMTVVRSGSGGDYEYTALHRDGSAFRIRATGYPVRYRGGTILVSIVGCVSDMQAALYQETVPVIQAGPAREGAAQSEERFTGAGPCREILAEPVFSLSVPAGIAIKAHERISLFWEVDETHLSADFGEIQPYQNNDYSSLISEIDDILGPEESMSSRDKGRQYILEWLADLKRMKRRYF
jgi:PAS domain S-box-containing protein